MYVGKAKNLRKRVYSYLNENKRSNRIKILISLTRQISFIKTLTELDALVLENNLIKKPKKSTLRGPERSLIFAGGYHLPFWLV